MTRFAWLLLAIAGCVDGGPDRDYPVVPGGGETPPISGGTSGQTLTGQVCVLQNLVNLRQCRTDNVGGFQVTIGGNTATTDDRGTFTVDAPAGDLTQQSFTVAGLGAVTTTTPYSPSLTVPVIDADVYARTLASNQLFATPGTGAILGTVQRGGNAMRDIVVASDPRGMYAPLYDTTGPGFGLNGTGARGVFWLPGIAAGPATLTMRDAVAGGETTVAGVQVVNGGVTILDSLALP